MYLELGLLSSLNRLSEARGGGFVLLHCSHFLPPIYIESSLWRLIVLLFENHDGLGGHLLLPGGEQYGILQSE